MSLRPLPADKVIKVLVKIGFKPVRQRGSHVILKRDDGRVTVIPVHRGEEIGRGLLSKIIKDAGLTKEEFLKLLKET
ncbi:MAG: type II toxin-antitoxin system HicA family toxin [archaeon YNP-WB-062]|nr:type II toxin-antitoxin system HicA family toxin [Candidatus Culexarchaeum yellowstonense]